MTRLIEIDRCGLCIHRRAFKTYYCALDPARREVNLIDIPSWCPLPVKEEKDEQKTNR